MKTTPGYPIRYAANASGVKPHLIRTWERRYNAITPTRTTTNRRIYTDADIHRLRLLKAAVDAGHTISRIAGMDTDTLAEIAGRPMAATTGSGPAGPETPEAASAVIDAALDAVIDLDAKRLEQVLESAAVSFTRPALLEDVLLPLFDRIGDLWAAGRVKIVGEHMATIVARTLLWDMLRTADMAESAPKLVVATPAGQWHELGAMVAALAAAETGWQPLYFGPNLPAEEIAAAVRHTGARALALGVAHMIDDNRLATELKKVRRFVGPHVPIFVGGRGIRHIGPTLDGIDARQIHDLAQFRSDLEGIALAETI